MLPVLDVHYYPLRLLKIFILSLLLFLPTTILASQQSEIEWLAYNIYHESRGEGTVGMIAVGVVTLLRVDNDCYPNNIHAVVTQRNQFSWYWDDLPDLPQETGKYKECRFWARVLYSMWKSGSLEKYVKKLNLQGVLWYHNNKVYPEWAYYKTKVVAIKNHLFYK